MAYSRNNWTQQELAIALANPVNAEAGPHAHSSKHAVSGELANHPLFQHARVTALITDDKHKSSNASYHAKNPDGSYQFSKNVRNQHPLPSAEVGTHSCLDVSLVAAAVKDAFNHHAMQVHLRTLDLGNDMKVFINFTQIIGRGTVHTKLAKTDTDFMCLFVYCKPNLGNKDIPIFQTVVPQANHKVGGADPIIVI